MASKKQSSRASAGVKRGNPTAGPARRRRGRPARISREGVVAAAVSLAEAEGPAQVTMARVAEEVGATPMALYRYIPNREALMSEVGDALIDQMDFAPPEGADWQECITAWMDSARAEFIARPHAMSLIGSSDRSSPAWMRALTPLVTTLRAAGFSEESTALGVVWVARLTIGVLLQEIAGSLTQEHLLNSLSSLEKDHVQSWLDIVPAFGRLGDDRFFDFVKAQAVEGVAALAREEKS